MYACGYSKGYPFRRPSTVAPYDPDAQLFIDAIGATGATADAINALFLDLKTGPLHGSDLFSIAGVIKPLVGGTSATHAVDAKTPGTQNATFVGSPTHNANGVTCNGTSQAILSGHVHGNPATWSKFAFLKTDSATGFTAVFGAYDGMYILFERSAFTAVSLYLDGGANASVRPNTAMNNQLVGMGQKDGTTAMKFIDSTYAEFANIMAGTNFSVQTAYMAANHVSAGLIEFLAGTINFIYETTTCLNENQCEDLEATIMNFNTALGR